MDLALISCVIFLSIEILQNNAFAGSQIYEQALNLLSNLGQSRSTMALDAEQELARRVRPILWNLGVAVVMMGKTPFVDRRSLTLKEHWKGGESSNLVFLSLDDARASFYALSIQIVSVCRELEEQKRQHGEDGVEWQRLRPLIRRNHTNLMRWHTAFTRLGIFPDTPGLPRNMVFTAATLHMSHAFLRTFATAHPLLDDEDDASGYTEIFSQMRSDRFLKEYTEIVRWGKLGVPASQPEDGMEPAYVPEMGISLSLFMTAIKCRHPKVRREALELLRVVPGAGGVCKAAPFSEIAKKIIEVEEGAPYQAELADQEQEGNNDSVPEERRICDFAIVPRETISDSESTPERHGIHGRYRQWCLKYTTRRKDVKSHNTEFVTKFSPF